MRTRLYVIPMVVITFIAVAVSGYALGHSSPSSKVQTLKLSSSTSSTPKNKSTTVYTDASTSVATTSSSVTGASASNKTGNKSSTPASSGNTQIDSNVASTSASSQPAVTTPTPTTTTTPTPIVVLLGTGSCVKYTVDTTHGNNALGSDATPYTVQTFSNGGVTVTQSGPSVFRMTDGQPLPPDTCPVPINVK